MILKLLLFGMLLMAVAAVGITLLVFLCFLLVVETLNSIYEPRTEPHRDAPVEHRNQGLVIDMERYKRQAQNRR